MFTAFHENELRDTFIDLSAVRFQTQEVNGANFTICTYMISDPEIWKRKNGFECRGIVFNEHGDIVARPFEKFFNLNENEFTQEHLIKKLFDSGRVRIQEKRDGSMLTPVLCNGEVRFKTKKSFYSDVAIAAQRDAEKIPGFIDSCKICIELGYTPIFEYTSPDSKIVIDYGKEPQFTLLAIRTISDGSYVYADEEILENPWSLFFDVSWIGEYYSNPSWSLLKEWVETQEDLEGWVIILPNGQRVKLKTKWYLSRHRLLDLRERDVAKMVIDETIDDIKSTAVERGLDLAIIEKIESKVLKELQCIIDQWNELESECRRLLRESGIEEDNSREYWSKVAFVAKDLLPYSFGTLMNKMRGKDLDYKKMWSDRFEKEYNLRSVYNSNFGDSNDD